MTAAVSPSAFANFAFVPIDVDCSAALDGKFWPANFVPPFKVLTMYEVPQIGGRIFGNAKLLYIPRALFGSVQALDPEDGF